jgi:hypothetical protein
MMSVKKRRTMHGEQIKKATKEHMLVFRFPNSPCMRACAWCFLFSFNRLGQALAMADWMVETG